ncbi:protein YIPF5 [Chrysoperla carnea]|uniref:protein YIPF5 n=1 Tax=Chrysoperla carnea TaxID=189513 RepID=UPI001D064C63|nr:protein YIPF5 [Chrysoperla carnea]
MSNYKQENDPFNAWNIPPSQYGQQPSMGFNTETDYNNLQSQQLDFQSFTVGDQNGYDQQQPPNYYNQNVPQQQYYSNVPNIFTPETPSEMADGGEPSEFDEPPLLEELEIYPDRILMKTLAVLNPFHSHSIVDDAEFLIKDTDLAGPVAFCLILAVCLFLSGNKANFGYIYGLSVMSCILMYCLLTLMSVTAGVFTLMGVASILGYCLLPIVALSALGVFVSLHNTLGLALAALAVIWSSLSASRLFVSVSGDSSQRPLIAYPCALVCGVFALLVVF